jgi:hypothetical protein
MFSLPQTMELQKKEPTELPRTLPSTISFQHTATCYSEKGQFNCNNLDADMLVKHPTSCPIRFISSWINNFIQDPITMKNCLREGLITSSATTIVKVKLVKHFSPLYNTTP